MPARLSLLLVLLVAAGCPEDQRVCAGADAHADPLRSDASAATPPDAGGEPGLDAGSADASPPELGDAATSAPADAASSAPIPLRYLSANLGNASFQFGCWEYKLCRPQDVQHLREYIALWRPDVVLLSEVYRADQLEGLANGGPILPEGWRGVCGKSLDRETGQPAAFDAPGASHEHECVAWKTSRVALVPGSAESAYGRNDAKGKTDCSYDFTGFRARLEVDGRAELTAVVVHPDSQNAECRVEEIGRYWSRLATGRNVVVAGDWNTESYDEIAKPAAYLTNYSKGEHWNLAKHEGEYSASYAAGLLQKQLDHAFSSSGEPCVDCGGFFHTFDLHFGSVLGGYDGHPRADEGEGIDHRQVLVDLWLTP
ncbi:MAG TPA: endonuclease/exonuclease/phosphatase family protein [Myxococcales bacterium]|jgi:hypothetical protein